MALIPPRYGQASLADVLPSVAAHLRGDEPVVAVPPASRYVVFLVDGLGHHPLRDHAGHAETLASADQTIPLTCGVPSTTAASLASLGCGVTPGQHGVVGYSFLDPEHDSVMNALTWEGGPGQVEEFCRAHTVFEDLAVTGTPSTVVSLAQFEDTPLTRISYRGARFVPVPPVCDAETFVALTVDAAESSTLVYCYDRMLDHAGHGHGVGSHQWLTELERIDDLVAALRSALPPDTCLLVTGDHGMINVPQESRVVVEEHPSLQGFRHIAGEGRFRQLHTDDPAAVAAAWQRFLGERAHVLRREEAVELGWFGPVADGVLPRIGDVLVAMDGDHAVLTQAFPGEFSLVGMHGSLTPAEMEVPLLVLGGQS